MTTDTQNFSHLRALAAEWLDRELDVDDFRCEGGSTSINKLMRAYASAADPNTVLTLIYKLEALQAEVARLREKVLQEQEESFDLRSTKSLLLVERNAALARLAAMEKQEPVAQLCNDHGRFNLNYDGCNPSGLTAGMKLYAAAGASPVEPTKPKLEQVLLDTALLINERPELRAIFLEMWGAQPSQAGEIDYREIADCVLSNLDGRKGVLCLDVDEDIEEEIRQEAADTIATMVRAAISQGRHMNNPVTPGECAAVETYARLMLAAENDKASRAAQLPTEAERLALELLAPVGEFPTPTKLESEAAALLRAQAAALLSIAALDPAKDSDEGYNEWGEADCFRKAQEIARAIVAPIKEMPC